MLSLFVTSGSHPQRLPPNMVALIVKSETGVSMELSEPSDSSFIAPVIHGGFSVPANVPRKLSHCNFSSV
jgi:hypothetical protein